MAESKTAQRCSAGGRVLLVDDDGTVRALARVLLESTGWQVSDVDDGDVALERLKSDTFDLVLLDLDMPRLGGRDVLAAIRATPATSRMPVVMLTGLRDEGVEAELIGQGARDCIRKPIDPLRFVARVTASFGRAGA